MVDFKAFIMVYFEVFVCEFLLLARHAIEGRQAGWGYLLREFSSCYFRLLCALDAG